MFNKVYNLDNQELDNLILNNTGCKFIKSFVNKDKIIKLQKKYYNLFMIIIFIIMLKIIKIYKDIISI